jgi:hypothetical protein
MQAVAYIEIAADDQGNEAQHWRLINPAGEEFFVIENVRASRERGVSTVLDYLNGPIPYVYLETRGSESGLEAQRWRRIRIPGEDFEILENVRLTRECGGSMVLDYRGGNLAYLEKRQGDAGGEAQRWHITTSTGENSLVIENVRRSRETSRKAVLDHFEPRVPPGDQRLKDLSRAYFALSPDDQAHLRASAADLEEFDSFVSGLEPFEGDEEGLPPQWHIALLFTFMALDKAGDFVLRFVKGVNDLAAAAKKAKDDAARERAESELRPTGPPIGGPGNDFGDKGLGIGGRDSGSIG